MASDTTPNPNKRKVPATADESTARPVRLKSDYSDGGDLVLKSIDGHIFHVHSVILSVASPVFADMFQVGSGVSGQVVDLAETGETITLMLGFIYPNESPAITSFEVLGNAMHVARKYQLEGMHRRLCRELAMSGSPVSYSADPLGAFAFATAHELKEETKLALEQAR